MRLAVLDAMTLKTRLMSAASKAVSGYRVPDVIKVTLYRAQDFGRPINVYTHACLRGDSQWTVQERELLAASISAANSCEFCATVHRVIAGTVEGEVDVGEVLDGGEAPSAQLSAAIEFARQLTLDPTSADASALREAGVTREQAEAVVHIVTAFNVINRVADAFEFEVPPAGSLGTMSKLIGRMGYRF